LYPRRVIAHDLRTLRALTARLLPGPPEDPDPGALEACAAEAIDVLLRAFTCEQPPIHAALEGGFVPLDPVAELGWRIRLEGSQGLPEREFAGPVKGLAQLVTDGLALLDRRSREAHGVDFADAPTADQDTLLDAPDEQLGAFVRLALTLTLEAVYGPAQYGGNRDGAGWTPLGWPGFTQPRGFTAAQVSEPDGGAAASREAVSELRSRLPDDASWQLKSD
jgi:gluconate 2-dehydrogenase gamma chain